MLSLYAYATTRFQGPTGRKRQDYADVDLLAHMCCFVAVQHYLANGEPLSRNACFAIVWDYIKDELWPLTINVPQGVRHRTVFLGKGRYARGSWRRWSGDLQGIVGAERFSDAAASTKRKAQDKVAKVVRSNAEAHLGIIINYVANRLDAHDNGALVSALNQLHSELF